MPFAIKSAARKKEQERHARLKNTRRIALTTRRAIRFDAMDEDGLATLSQKGWYSLTLALSDINYQLADTATRKSVLDRWMGTINQFDDRTRIQLTVANRMVSAEDSIKAVAIQPTGDRNDPWRKAFNDLASEKLARMGQRVVTDKFLTIAVQEKDREKARAALDRLTRGTQDELAALGCHATPLDRTERLRLIHRMLLPGDPYAFSERAYASKHRPLNSDVKSWVTPWSIDFHDHRPLHITGIDDYWQTHLSVENWPAQLTDTLISDLASIPADIVITIHMRPWDRAKGIEAVARKQTAVDEDYDKAVEQNAKLGLGPESVPASIVHRKDEMTSLLEGIQTSNTRIIDTVLLVSATARTKDQLDNAVQQIKQTARRLSVQLNTVRYFMPEALNAMLPLGYQELPHSRALTTDTASILIPFTSQELMEPHGLLYGVNARSGNPIVINRASHMNYNGFILGTTGSGKSQSAKSEIAQHVLRGGERVLVIDPEHEYEALAHALGGRVITISADSQQHLNPMDIRFDSDEPDPVRGKSSEVISLLGALISGATGMDAVTKALIDKACMSLYSRCRSDWENTQRWRQPVLKDLQDEIKRENIDGNPHPQQQAIHLVTELELFSTGSSAGFGQSTNVDVSAPFVVFDVSGLRGESRTFGMMTVLNAVWALVRSGRAQGTRTWLYVDEFHTFFHNSYSITTFLDIYKRARKYGLGVTGITQNIDELLDNPQARLMLSNADFLLLMNQKKSDADQLQDLLGLSNEQMRLISNVHPGCGLVNTAGASIGVDNVMDTTNPLYKLYSTKFGEKLPDATRTPAPAPARRPAPAGN